MADRSIASECESDCIGECRNMSTGVEVCYISELFQSSLGCNCCFKLQLLGEEQTADLLGPGDLIGYGFATIEDNKSFPIATAENRF